MIFFTVVFNVLIFAVCAGAIIAVGIVVLVIIPAFIYSIPYGLWVGKENCVGRQKDKKGEKLWATVKHATKLYGCWITRRKPNL